MLGKLIKYELKSTARVFLPLYLILLFFALISRFSVSELIQRSVGENRILEVLSGVVITGYVFIIFSVLIITFVIVIQRFYKNLTGDEGYLMHTLPVSTHSLIQSKVVGAFIWQFLSGTMVFVSMFLLFVTPEFFQELPYFFQELGEVMGYIWSEIGMGLVANILLFLAILLVGALSSTLMIYAAIAVGHTFKKHRVMGSVVAYMGLSMVSSFAMGIGSSILAFFNFDWDFLYFPTALNVSNMVSLMFLLVIVGELLFAVVWYFISHYVLTNQLNLE